MPDQVAFPGDDQSITVEVRTEYLYPGAILKGDAFTESGEKIVEAFQPISDETIQLFKLRNLKIIYYIRPAPSLKNTSSKMAIPLYVLEKALTVAEEIEISILKKSQLPQKDIEETVEEMINQISLAETDAILSLLELKNFDEYTYTHSINVCMLAILFAKKLLWSEEKIRQLGIGSMLHDIGKILVPREILNKKGKLDVSEWEVMKKHTLFGYEIMKNQSHYSEEIWKTCLLHHENYDGKGYPLLLNGDKIGEMAGIVSLCDTFDAMTSIRPYKLALPFWTSFLFINNQSAKKFNPRLTASFVSILPKHVNESAVIPNGTFVMLNTGEAAQVVKASNVNIFKPVVNLLINSRREALKYPSTIDLTRDGSRYIENIVEEKSLLLLLEEVVHGS